MKSTLLRYVAFAAAISVLVETDVAAQFQSGVTKVQQAQNDASRPESSQRFSSGVRVQNSYGLRNSVSAQKRPWRLSSRIHLEKGTNKGYLVVQLDMQQGYHVYSLNANGSPSPTQLIVKPMKDLRVLSKFVSDTAPIVIAKDPTFGQRIEKHKGKVQFFASVEVRPGIDLQSLTQEVEFSGQICSESACRPIRKLATKAKFAGFFDSPKTRKAATKKALK